MRQPPDQRSSCLSVELSVVVTVDPLQGGPPLGAVSASAVRPYTRCAAVRRRPRWSSGRCRSTDAPALAGRGTNSRAVRVAEGLARPEEAQARRAAEWVA